MIMCKKINLKIVKTNLMCIIREKIYNKHNDNTYIFIHIYIDKY